MTPKPTISSLKRAEKCAREALELRDDPAYVRVLRVDLEAFMAANGGWDATPGTTKRLRAAVKGEGK